jgi:hypothetical protein
MRESARRKTGRWNYPQLSGTAIGFGHNKVTLPSRVFSHNMVCE